jgi:hypothetical protein
MNPSATGWSRKLTHELSKGIETWTDVDKLNHFQSQTGFLYGAHLHSWEKLKLPALTTPDEIAKVNLFISLYSVAVQHKVEDLPSALNTFYAELGLISAKKAKRFTSISIDTQMEKLIDSRIYLGGGLFKKSMGVSMTNGLLQLDVLLFDQYLSNQSMTPHFSLYENFVLEAIQDAASLRKSVDRKHFKIAKLIEDSKAFRPLSAFNCHIQAGVGKPKNLSAYALRMAAVTLWENEGFSPDSIDLLFKKGYHFQLTDKEIQQLLTEVDLFYTTHHHVLPNVKNSNMVYTYYEGLIKIAARLIYRNRDRIKRELKQNKELLQLIKKSTQTELSVKEKEQMKTYILDSFKSIPSIALFLLPGGSVLLPIVASLLPKLLPSSFDDNRID